MACNLTTIQTDACTSGIGKVTDTIELLQLIAQLTCEAAEAGIAGNPALPLTSVQFNDGGVFGGDADFTWNKTTNVLTLPAITPGGISGIYSGAITLVRRFQAAPGAGGQSTGDNVFVGNAGNSTMTNGAGITGLASFNTAVGDKVFLANTTGQYNSAFGHGVLQDNTIGDYNTGIGGDALRSNTTGTANVAVGVDSLFLNLTGAENVAVGNNALLNVTASANTAVGNGALTAATGSGECTGIGYRALSTFNGAYASALGSGSGRFLTGGAENTFVGAYAGGSAGQAVSVTNSTALGAAAVTTASNQVIIGDVRVTNVYCGSVTAVANLFAALVSAPILRTSTAYTVATLPAAGTAGRRAYVTNALAPVYGAAVAGAGAVVTSVMDNGVAWIVS